jgi:uncharacterized protein Yka (UPF0111/DUF47 family)
MFGQLFRRKDYGFFELFEKQASGVLTGVRELQTMMSDLAMRDRHAQRIEETEHQCDTYTHMAFDLLHRCYVTPLDRDEIGKLMTTLDDIVDSTHVTAKRTLLYDIRTAPASLQRMTAVLVEATDHVLTMVKRLRGLKAVDEVRQLGEEVHRLENEGDRLLTAGLTELLAGNPADALAVMKMKEIYEAVERSIDRCEDVANIVSGIFLEHA